MDLPLALQLVLVVVLLWESRFHLLEAFVMHLGRIDVAADQLGPKGFRQRNADIQRHVGMIGVIHRHIDRFVHSLSLTRAKTF